MASQRVSARRPFMYMEYDLDRGQVFSLRGARNDDKLVEFKYVDAVPAKADTYVCDECGAEFIEEYLRRGHYEKRHPARPRTPEEEDRFLDREESQLDAVNRSLGPQPAVSVA